jgi:hypothetical protein
MPETSLPSPEATKPDFRDRVGISLSGICVVHCLLLPVALAALPLWPVLETAHAWLHPVFAVLLLPTTLAAMAHGYRRHRRNDIAGLLGAGLVLILGAGFLGHAMPGAFTETALTVLGSALLITGHWRNWRTNAACRLPAPAA